MKTSKLQSSLNERREHLLLQQKEKKKQTNKYRIKNNIYYIYAYIYARMYIIHRYLQTEKHLQQLKWRVRHARCQCAATFAHILCVRLCVHSIYIMCMCEKWEACLLTGWLAGCTFCFALILLCITFALFVRAFQHPKSSVQERQHNNDKKRTKKKKKIKETDNVLRGWATSQARRILTRTFNDASNQINAFMYTARSVCVCVE